MKKIYNEALVMPSSYAAMDEEEMTYVDGGWDYTYSTTNIAVPIKKKFLSRAVCIAFGTYMIFNKGNGIWCNNMTAERIAMELYAHAKAYYAASALIQGGVNKEWVRDIQSCGKVADIGWGDGLFLAYDFIWRVG